jgi:hypothetical protein
MFIEKDGVNMTGFIFPQITAFNHELLNLPPLVNSELLNGHLGRFHYFMVVLSYFKISPGQSFNIRLDL